MFNRKSSYALNKKDPNAIVYMDANEAIIRLTREDFASEEEFLKWKSWSDENYHTEDNQDVVEGKHNTSIDDLSEAALSIPAIDVVMERQHEKSERRRVASAMVSQIRDNLTKQDPVLAAIAPSPADPDRLGVSSGDLYRLTDLEDYFAHLSADYT